jgi:uncharacterized membrane protein YfcA
MLILALLGAAVVGLSLGLMGSGGSILAVPVLVYLVGQDEKVAIAGSMGIVAAISAIAAIPYARRGLVAWRSVLWFGLPGMAGAWIGAAASKHVAGAVQLSVFAALMLVAAYMMLRPAREAKYNAELLVMPVPARTTESAARLAEPVAFRLAPLVVMLFAQPLPAMPLLPHGQAVPVPSPKQNAVPVISGSSRIWKALM